MLAQTEVSVHVHLPLASSDKGGAIQAYRDEANVDLTIASRVIDAL